MSGTSRSIAVSALYVKTKNFHWHLSGPRFRDYHLLLDEQAASILDSVDVLAERVRKIGRTTLWSVGHIRQLARIQDDDEDHLPTSEMSGYCSPTITGSRSGSAQRSSCATAEATR